MPSPNKPDEGLGLGQGLLLGFNSLASPLPCQVSQSLGEHSGPASEPCPALPCPSPCRAHQAERSNDPRVCRAKDWKHPDTTRDKSRTRHDKGPPTSPARPAARPPVNSHLAPASTCTSCPDGAGPPHHGASWGSSNGTARLRLRIPEERGSLAGSRQYHSGRRKNLSSTPTLPGGARRPGLLDGGSVV